tara:strand:+ start:607 stop:1293 length:687 start_codon:yes stop_codon:yes gene_type:complete
MNVVNKKYAIVLFSGGLDSTTTLMIAKSLNFNIIALTINYKQRHISELDASKHILNDYPDIKHIVFDVNLSKIGGSALTDSTIDVPDMSSDEIPVTYVPARNTIFLSIAAAYAERFDIADIFIGVNAIDYSGYPDCRPEFITSFEDMINLGTKSGVTGKKITIHAPLVKMKKHEIILSGVKHGVDYSKTLSCYNPSDGGLACNSCDACHFRKEGFRLAGVNDPTRYKK